MENSVVMVKGLLPEVAKEVGKSAALFLQQLFQWFKSKPVDRVYRTNEELFEDLNGVLSPATIQRCKQRLVENGYIIVSFNKGLNRVTHYKLTEKGQALLDEAKVRKVEVKPTEKQAEKQAPKYERKQPTAKPKSNNVLESNPAMQESFKEGFGNKAAVPMPENIRSLFAKKKAEQAPEVKAAVDVVDVVEAVEAVEVDLEWDAIVQAEMEMQEDNFSDEDYAGVELAMLQAIEDNTKPEAKPMTFNELMQTAYSKAANSAQEALYSMKQDMQYFKEEF